MKSHESNGFEPKLLFSKNELENISELITVLHRIHNRALKEGIDLDKLQISDIKANFQKKVPMYGTHNL